YGARRVLNSFPTRRSSDLFFRRACSSIAKLRCETEKAFSQKTLIVAIPGGCLARGSGLWYLSVSFCVVNACPRDRSPAYPRAQRSEEHTSELQSRENLVCR